MGDPRVAQVTTGTKESPSGSSENERDRLADMEAAVSELLHPEDERVIEETPVPCRLRDRLQAIDQICELLRTPSLRVPELTDVVRVPVCSVREGVVSLAVPNPREDRGAHGVTQLDRDHRAQITSERGEREVALSPEELCAGGVVIFIEPPRRGRRVARVLIIREECTLDASDRIEVLIELYALDRAHASSDVVELPEHKVKDTPPSESETL